MTTWDMGDGASWCDLCNCKVYIEHLKCTYRKCPMNVPSAVPTDALIKEEMDRVFGAMKTSAPKWWLERKITPPEAPPRNDMVVLPAHYSRYPIEPITFAVENGLNFLQSNIIKYVVRYEHKNGLEDCLKALRLCEMMAKRVAGDPDWSKASTVTLDGMGLAEYGAKWKEPKGEV